MALGDPQFYTATGWLTPYALGCGYIELDERDGIRTTLWAEGGVYHVRQHNHNPETFGRVFWDVFDTLQEARERFAWARCKVAERKISTTGGRAQRCIVVDGCSQPATGPPDED